MHRIRVDPEPLGNITRPVKAQSPIGCFVAREFGEPLWEGKQMGTVPWTVYAPTRRNEHCKLPEGLDWKTVRRKVKRLQMRIAKVIFSVA